MPDACTNRPAAFTGQGSPPDEIAGCIIPLIPYVGYPRSLSALKVAQDVFAEEGVAISEGMVEQLKSR